jgi:hypothetical protein
MTKANKTVVAELCLYGNGASGCGAGWLVKLADGRFLGSGDPVKGRGFTEAVWDGMQAVREAEVVKGLG